MNVPPSRLIPAHAGSTWRLRWSSRVTRAHPRSRGEHTTNSNVSGDKGGSSPLTRRALLHSPELEVTPGLIPAHAGSTRAGCPAGVDGWAHPRSRGEHSWPTLSIPSVSGSSPLTRGARPLNITIAGAARLIPAHAGSTLSSAVSSMSPRAHPRSRGEHLFGQSADALGNGSSPLTRGARPGTRLDPPLHRLIPAHAGSTSQ